MSNDCFSKNMEQQDMDLLLSLGPTLFLSLKNDVKARVGHVEEESIRVWFKETLIPKEE